MRNAISPPPRYPCPSADLVRGHEEIMIMEAGCEEGSNWRKNKGGTRAKTRTKKVSWF
jgi:hypothetical protein